MPEASNAFGLPQPHNQNCICSKTVHHLDRMNPRVLYEAMPLYRHEKLVKLSNTKPRGGCILSFIRSFGAAWHDACRPRRFSPSTSCKLHEGDLQSDFDY
jgi:hypothetical protein